MLAPNTSHSTWIVSPVSWVLEEQCSYLSSAPDCVLLYTFRSFRALQKLQTLMTANIAECLLSERYNSKCFLCMCWRTDFFLTDTTNMNEVLWQERQLKPKLPHVVHGRPGI